MKLQRDNRLFAGLLAVASVITASQATAQNPIDDALNWLDGVQNPSGSWGSATEFIDTATAVETLAAVDPSGAPLAAAAIWLSDQVAPNHQFLARRMSALIGAAGFEIFAALRSVLLHGELQRPCMPDSSRGARITEQVLRREYFA